jgi:hemerythrin superfamily protein
MNRVADRITPSITTMIRMDHSHVLALFHRYKQDTPQIRKRALVTNACIALQVHAQLEEEIFYPALRNVLSGDDVLDKSEPEHNEMRRFIGELRELGASESGGSETGGSETGGSAGLADEAAYDEKFFALMRLVIHHVADEETRLLPAAERLLRDQLGHLGVEMTKRRLQLMKPYAAEFAQTTVRSFPAGAAAGAVLLLGGALAVSAMLLSSNSKGAREKRMSR